MSYNFDQHPEKSEQIRLLLAAGILLLAWAFGLSTWAVAQKPESTATPAGIAPPAGNRVFLTGHAVGTQGYVCLPASSGASWTVNGSRPEAELFSDPDHHNVPGIHHFLSPNANPNQYAPRSQPFGNPTWESTLDGSKVWAQTLRAIPAGTDSCPHAGAIGCLLLQAVGSEKGPAGGTAMTGTTYIQRLNTQGGSAPATGCSGTTDVGKQTLVPYTADYYFFRADQ